MSNQVMVNSRTGKLANYSRSKKQVFEGEKPRLSQAFLGFEEIDLFSKESRADDWRRLLLHCSTYQNAVKRWRDGIDTTEQLVTRVLGVLRGWRLDTGRADILAFIQENEGNRAFGHNKRFRRNLRKNSLVKRVDGKLVSLT